MGLAAYGEGDDTYLPFFEGQLLWEGNERFSIPALLQGSG